MKPRNTEDPTSVVVVRWPRGWVAHIRFDDKKLDETISAPTRHVLDYKIKQYFGRNVNETTRTGE